MSTLFSDEWLQKMPKDPYERVIAVGEHFDRAWKAAKGAENLPFSHFLELNALLKVIAEAANLTPDRNPFAEINEELIDEAALRGSIIRALREVRTKAFARIEARTAAETAQYFAERFQAIIIEGSAYVLTDYQVAELQRLINELRERIANADSLKEEHRSRLLKRLEKLQFELHKNLSTLDSWYGTAMDILAMAQTLQEKAKPIVDLTVKIVGIAWAVHSQKDGLGLPSVFAPLQLPPSSEPQDANPIPIPSAKPRPIIDDSGPV